MDEDDNSCVSIGECSEETIKLIFDFSPATIGPLEVSFAFTIIIVQLNVVIAIVSEAWDRATIASTVVFWKYRLEKISHLHFAYKMPKYLVIYFAKFTIFPYPWIYMLEKIDGIRNISYRKNIIWARAPFHVMTEKDHYDNPHKYFDPVQVISILDAHSLQGDLYWAKIDADVDLSLSRRASILFKWLSCLVFYFALIILGIPTFGILWPLKFRSALLLNLRFHSPH